MIQDGRKASNGAMHEASQESGNAANLDRAVDTLATLLRDFGLNAFDLPERSAQALEQLCDQWANHVLFAAPSPDTPVQSERMADGRRNWSALRNFFVNQRNTETHYVTNALTGMRQVLWTCVNEMRQAIVGNTQSDDRLQEQMDHLQEVVQTADLAALRQEVLSVITSVNHMLEKQQEQNRLSIEAMHAHIQHLDGLLAQARKENALDALTQLFNRRAFMDKLAYAVDQVDVFQDEVCMFLVDADHFKSINDTHGHPAGDSVLKALANCLVRQFPSGSDCVARYGGEEFAVISQGMTVDEGRRMAERLLQAVRDLTVRTGNTSIQFTVSIGLASAKPGENADAWTERVDRALYEAKQGGRNCYRVGC